MSEIIAPQADAEEETQTNTFLRVDLADPDEPPCFEQCSRDARLAFLSR